MDRRRINRRGLFGLAAGAAAMPLVALLPERSHAAHVVIQASHNGVDWVDISNRVDPTLTVYEIGQRVREYISHALPLFEPLEGPLARFCAPPPQYRCWHLEDVSAWGKTYGASA